MARTGISRPSKWKICFAALVVLALAVGAAGSATAARRQAEGPRPRCGREATSSSASPSSTTTRSADFVDFERGDQEKTAQVFVDYINDNGGVGGRKIVPVLQEVRADSRAARPIRWRSARRGPKTTASSPCSACSSTSPVRGSSASPRSTTPFTSATSSSSRGSTSRRPACSSRPTPRRRARPRCSINLLVEGGKLKGKKVGILSDQNSEDRINDVVKPALKTAKDQDGFDGGARASPAPTRRPRRRSSTASSRSGRTRASTRSTWPASRLRRSSSSRRSRRRLPKALLIADSELDGCAGPGRGEGGGEPEPVRGHARLPPGRPRRSGGRTRARSCSSASTSTRRPPARRCRARTRPPRTPRARRRGLHRGDRLLR